MPFIKDAIRMGPFSNFQQADEALPQERTLDSSLALLSEGYLFISHRCQKFQSDIFQTRLMLRNVICMQGEEAGRIFYDGTRFTRKGGVPITTLKLLQDIGSVQSLDGEAHHARKRMIMSLMDSASINKLIEIATREWRLQIFRWQKMREVVLHNEVEEILCRSVCYWAGLPLTPAKAHRRTKECSALIDRSGSVGAANWFAQRLRARTERWSQKMIHEIREGKVPVSEGSPAHVIAFHKDANGHLLSIHESAVELINLLRPTVAVARFVTFAALALYENPHCKEWVPDEPYLEHFIQEVRRFYPFFPFIGGRVNEEFDWRGHHFTKGEWVLYDLYGTNHDPKIWKNPNVFDPNRFRDWNGSAYSLVPQGAGDPLRGHRCPGEGITIDLMKMAVRLLCSEMHYQVPKQDLTIDLSRMPAIPKSGFIITKIQRTFVD